MRLAIHQSGGVFGDVPANLESIEASLARAAREGADLLILPEMFLTGYNLGGRTAGLAEPADGPSAERIAAAAALHGVAVLYGYPEAADSVVYNSAQLIGADGARVTNYRKLHLYGGERGLFVAGDARPEVVELAGLRLGVMICYDVEFPEAVRALVDAGADLVCVPTALMEPHRLIPLSLVPTRAWENQCFVAYTNRCGVEGDLKFPGLSCLVAPDGSELLRAGEEEAWLVAEIRPGDYAETRRLNDYAGDLRRDLYPTG